MSNPLGPPNLDGVNLLIGWAIAAEVEKMRQWRLEKEIQDKNYWRPKIYEKISREYSNLDDKGRERVFESEYEKIKRQRLENVPLMRVGCGERI